MDDSEENRMADDGPTIVIPYQEGISVHDMLTKYPGRLFNPRKLRDVLNSHVDGVLEIGPFRESKTWRKRTTFAGEFPITLSSSCYDDKILGKLHIKGGSYIGSGLLLCLCEDEEEIFYEQATLSLNRSIRDDDGELLIPKKRKIQVVREYGGEWGGVETMPGNSESANFREVMGWFYDD